MELLFLSGSSPIFIGARMIALKINLFRILDFMRFHPYASSKIVPFNVISSTQ